MGQLPVDILSGLPFGSVYGLIALGLLLAYRTSGIINLSFGAQAYVVALFFNAAIDSKWPVWVSFLIWGCIFGPLVGILLDRIIFQHVRSSSTVIKLVSVLGVLVAAPPLASLAVGSKTVNPHSLLLHSSRVYLTLFSDPINGEEVSTVLATVICSFLLYILLNKTTVGIKMKSVVESPRLSELSGVQSERLGALSFGLSSFLAGLAGILLAPALHVVGSTSLTSLAIDAVAAASVGGFISLSWTMFGAMILGVGQEIIAGYAPSGAAWAHGLRPSLPFIVLTLAVIFHPRLSHLAGTQDPLGQVDPPVSHIEYSDFKVSFRVKVMLFLGLVLVFLYASVSFPRSWIFDLTQGGAFGIIFLSITLLTGVAGQISLAQASLAGIGAFGCGQLAVHFGVNVIAGAFIGAVFAAVVGLIVGVFATRLEGLGIALVTLAFALLSDSLLFPLSWIGNGGTGLSIPRPVLGFINLTADRPFFIFVTVLLGIFSWLVNVIKNSKLGLDSKAVSESKVGAFSVGIREKKVSLLIFVFASFIAGFGGAIYAIVEGSVSSTDFNSEFSLVFLVIVVVMGVATVEGAIVGGYLYVVATQLMTVYAPQRFSVLIPIGIGVLAVFWVLHPEGVVERQTRKLVNVLRTKPRKHLEALIK